MMKQFLLAVLLATTLAAPTWAAIQPQGFTLTPIYGGHSFEGNLSLDDSDFWGIGIGYNINKNWALEGVYTKTEADGDPSSASDATVETYRIDGLYHLWPDRQFVPFLSAGLGGITTDPDYGDNHDHLLVNYGAGFKYFILDDLIALRAEVRHLLDFPEPDNSLQYSIGLMFQLGKPAPAPEPVAVPAPQPVPAPKPAPAPVDSDGDGIFDASDECPGTASGVPVDSRGCPIDTDNDGVFDHQDKCPATPPGAPVDMQGCPTDSDNDGVADYLDKCPGTASGIMVDETGCPLDSDRDGVYDHLDQCPDTPAGVSVDINGCPTTLTLRINFGHDSSRIGPEYDSEIAKAAECIRTYPGNTVFIDGHTDSSGSAEYNKTLSMQRATAVKNRLAERFNINSERMTARGFGEEKPVADNSTAEGMALNRRVEVACGAR